LGNILSYPHICGSLGNGAPPPVVKIRWAPLIMESLPRFEDIRVLLGWFSPEEFGDKRLMGQLGARVLGRLLVVIASN